MTTTTAEYQPIDITKERCDRCTARAFVRAHSERFELFFCGHHAQQHFEALTDKGFYIQDETYRQEEY